MATRRSTRSVRVIVESLNGFVEQIIIGLTLDVVANLKAAPGQGGTPVDTGWARSNWIPNIGEPLDAPVGSRSNVSTGPQNQAEAGIAGYTLSKGRVYISNNVPYILRLNEGSSRQAPAGFVQRAVAKAVREDLARKFQ